jgi:hypothetical protein
MPRWPGQAERSSKYTPLVAYLAAEEGNHVTLTFTEIEAMIGVPLPVSAQVGLSFWIGRRQRVLRDLAAIGWRARLRVREHAVEFRRISTAMIDPEAERRAAPS